VERSRNRDGPNEGGLVPMLDSHQGWTTIDVIRIADWLTRVSECYGDVTTVVGAWPSPHIQR